MRLILSGAFIALWMIGSALAQPVIQNSFSGNECWNAGQGVGGPTTGAICIAQARNGTGLQTFSGSGAFTTTALYTNSTLYWVGTAPTTWTITLPSPSFDGQIISVATDTTLTTMVTVTPATGQTMDGTFNAQTISANTSVEFQFSLAQLKWFRLR